MKTAIIATINGTQRTCEIRRKDLRFFEAMFGSSLALFNRIRGSEWGVEDLRAIIEFATGRRPKEDDTIDSFRMVFVTSVTRRREASVWIDKAFEAWGPANYVPLALGIIAAALWGVPPDDAVFTDGSELTSEPTEAEPVDGD